MAKKLLASDRVVLLLSLVPYLRENGPTPVTDLAHTFDVDPVQLRQLVSFLATAGIPGETLSYQHDDLFDIDWDALEMYDIVALTQTVAIDETPRFTGVETAALLAGLHALESMLPESDVILARGLGERLRKAFGVPDMPSVTVASVEPDARLASLLTAINEHRRVRFRYGSSEGTTTERILEPSQLNEREGVWYVTGLDTQRHAERMFRVDRVSRIELLDAIAAPSRLDDSDAHVEGAGRQEPRRSTDSSVDRGSGESIIATVPVRLLPTLRGFAPQVVGELDLGRVQISIEAWHPGAAVRLIQHGPGEIEIISPAAARAAVSEWAEAALVEYGD